MASRQLKLPIKCQLIGGQLNSGKTSAILSLFATKPKDEVWAVLVNEAGAVGIDQALLSGPKTSNGDGDTNPTGGIKIKMLGGGCLCCTLSSVTSASLVQLVRSSKPDRLIIEPSGLAHPKALLEMLTGPHLASALDLQPIICLVDLSTFNPAGNFADEDVSFMAQVNLADVLIGTKADICSRQQQDDFIAWALALEPRPAKILISTTAEINFEDLSLVLEEAKAKLATEKNTVEEEADRVEEHLSSLFSDGLFLQEQDDVAGKSRQKKVWLTNAPGTAVSSAEEESTIAPRQPIRKELAAAPRGTSTCGWVFHSEDVFSAAELKKFATASLPHILRLKGIFRIEREKWVVISIGTGRQNAQESTASAATGRETNGESGDGVVVLQPLDGMYHDSRVEIIVEQRTSETNSQGELADALRFKNWTEIETMLLQLLVPPPLPPS
jgi:G3E family GTPase